MFEIDGETGVIETWVREDDGQVRQETEKRVRMGEPLMVQANSRVRYPQNKMV